MEIKYYRRKQEGGWSPCILGNDKKIPRHTEMNTLPNCVSWGVGRYNEIGNYNSCKYLGSVNANKLLELAKSQGLPTGNTPKVGALICWDDGNCGHCAIVEKVNSDGSIYVSESGWSAKSYYWNATLSGPNYTNGEGWLANGGYKLQGFVYQIEPEPTYKFKIGDKVILSGQLYASSTSDKKGKKVSNIKTTITRLNPNSKHPYNTTGDLGWVDESSLSIYKEDELKVGDVVVPTKLVDYRGVRLIQYDSKYEISAIDNRGYVLRAIRGTQRPIWAILPKENIRRI